MAFNGQVALVTGGGSGMGQISAWRLAETGASVGLMDVNQEGMSQTAEGRPNIRPFLCDVTDMERVKEVVAQIERDWGPIDRVTHAAGVMPASPVVEDDPDRMKRIMRINYDGTVNLLMTTLPPMVRRGFGDWICYGSIVGVCAPPHLGAYSATKAAVNSLMESFIWENRNSGVRMMLICPSAVKTPLIDQALNTSNPRSLQASLEQDSMADPAEVVEVVERDLERGKKICYPLGQAKFLKAVHKLSEGWLWRQFLKIEEM